MMHVTPDDPEVGSDGEADFLASLDDAFDDEFVPQLPHQPVLGELPVNQHERVKPGRPMGAAKAKSKKQPEFDVFLARVADRAALKFWRMAQQMRWLEWLIPAALLNGGSPAQRSCRVTEARGGFYA